MSNISKFLADQKAYNDRNAAALDKIVASQDGLTADIKALNDKIAELQNSPGEFSAEDQILADAAEAQGKALAEKQEAVAAALEVLDAQTPPVVPPVQG